MNERILLVLFRCVYISIDVLVYSRAGTLTFSKETVVTFKFHRVSLHNSVFLRAQIGES